MARVSTLAEPTDLPADEGIETRVPSSALVLELPSPVPCTTPGPADGPLLDRALTYLRAALAPATLRAYRSDWQHWERWALSHGAVPLPAAPAALALYLADQAPTLRASTLRRRLASLAVVHRAEGLEAPVRSAPVRAVLAGISRTHGTAVRQARPVLVEDLRAMLAQLTHGPRGKRDRALVLLGWSAALRESELVALDLVDVREVNQGLEVTVRRSKTDQGGEGRTIPVGHGSRAATCPVRAWRTWQEQLERLTSLPPAFPRLTCHRNTFSHHWSAGERLRPRAVEEIVSRLARLAGLEPRTGHSLRAGFATTAAAAGIPDRVIMAVTGHQSRTTLDRYVRAGHLWDDCPTGRLL